jgi:hypothetical protein
MEATIALGAIPNVAPPCVVKTTQIEDFQDTAEAREELIPWLMDSDQEPLTHTQWKQRLAHWWDENPFADMAPRRGWTLRHQGRIVGFMALIPTCYAIEGRAAPSYIASTWRVDEPHRNRSLPMLMKLRPISATTLISDTTAIPDVQLLLKRSNWISCPNIQRHFVAMGMPGRILQRRSWPELSPGVFLTRDPRDVFSVSSPCSSSTGIEKWITPDYLRWFAAGTMRRHEFVGAIDSSGCLTSYLFLTPKRVRGIPAWMEIDHFTTHRTPQELHALVGALVREPTLLGRERLLSLAAFPGDTTWDDTPSLHQRREHVWHFFSIPEAYRSLAKRTVMAEGDLGL